MSARSSEQSDATNRIVAQISVRITVGRVDLENLFALTGQLMELAQTERLAGAEKKQVVMDAFDRITDDKPETVTFMNEVMPSLVDTIKMVARGGLRLAVDTQCCGLVGA